jgi:hypothetical protein
MVFGVTVEHMAVYGPFSPVYDEAHTFYDEAHSQKFHLTPFRADG